MLNIKFTHTASAILYNDTTSAVISATNSSPNTGEFIFQILEPLSKNDLDCYHFLLTGKPDFLGDKNTINISGYIDSVTQKQQYCNLFKNCTNIKSASALVLSAPNMKESCYANMFLNCTNLKYPPQIQAQNLDMWCFQNMFAGCTSLKKAPILSATTLAPYCYYAMFYNCTSLTAAPYLPAEILEDWCYNSMFYNCNNLELISANFTEWKGNATSSWVTNITNDRGFFINDNVLIIKGNSYVPTGWNKDFIKISPTEQGKFNLKLGIEGAPRDQYFKTIKWKGYWGSTHDGSPYETPWEEVTFAMAAGYAASKSATSDDFILISGDSTDLSGFFRIKITNNTSPAKVEGNINSLINFQDQLQVNEIDGTYYGEYQKLFENSSGVVDASGLKLPSIARQCYQQMFENCVNLSAAPILSATELDWGCYYGMFTNCKALTVAPYLPAETLTSFCYSYMFSGCSNLSSISVNFTNWFAAQNNTYMWVSGVANEGTFTKPADLPEEFSTSQIPSGWTVINKEGE